MLSPVGVPARSPSISARVVGVLRSPRRTLRGLLPEPRWVDVLVLTCALTAAARIGFMSTPEGRQALTDQWVSRAEAFGQTVTDASYAQFQRLGERAIEMATATSVASALLLPFALAFTMQQVFGRGTGIRYPQALAVVVHAGVILALREVIAAPVNYAREAVANPLTLGTFFQMLDAGSPAARALSMLDLFIVWWLVVLAVGTSVLYGRPARRIATGYLVAYVVVAIAMAAAMAVAGGT